ncbi:MAG: zinc ribbon domain-containing protein [Cryobacterium sp.]|nr:zinc ribbon domain-containing protein [Oligoflexia bacterium]
MPMYEYRCENCEKISEELQKFSDLPLTDCELCGTKGSLSKLISKSSFALKGTGWYTTDYKKSSAPSENAKSNDSASTPAAPSAGTPSAGASDASVKSTANASSSPAASTPVKSTPKQPTP